jgi:tellurite resistance protein TerC
VFGLELPEISTQFSLVVIIGTLLVTTVASLIRSSKTKVAE